MDSQLRQTRSLGYHYWNRGSLFVFLHCEQPILTVNKFRSGTTYLRFKASNSSNVLGQSPRSNRDKLLSASTLPPVWHRAQ